MPAAVGKSTPAERGPLLESKLDMTHKNRRIEPGEGTLSHALYRTIVDNIPQMVWTARPDGEVEFLNARVSQYTGMAAGDLVGWGWREVLHPEDLGRAERNWKRALNSGRGYEAEYRLRRHDGAYRWHSHSVIPLLDDAGKVLLWYGSVTDIDEQNNAIRLLEQARQTLESLVAARTQALEQGDQRLRAFLDSMPAIAWIKDSQQRYTWISASYTRVLGKRPEEMLGRLNFEVWGAELAEQFRGDDEKVLRAGSAVQALNNVPAVDGTMMRLMVLKFPLPDASGQTGIAAVGFDISPLRELNASGDGERDALHVLQRLSARERQVLQLVVDGLTSAQIGERLGLSPKSVDTYRSRLMTKLSIGDLPSLVKFALRHGLTTYR
jgi:PAS domain S-box-containing protein